MSTIVNLFKKVLRRIVGTKNYQNLQVLRSKINLIVEPLKSNPDSLFAIHLQRKLPRKYKIGMAVLIHERADYLELCLDSLFNTNLYDYDITFLLIDDGSKDPRVREIINRSRDQKYKIIRLFCNKGHDSWGAAYNRAMRELLKISRFDILGSCDSDALFHPEWLNQTMKVCTWAKEHDRQYILGAFSSFNSSDFIFHQVLDTYETPFGNYVVKKRMGALNHFLFYRDFKKLGFFAEDKNDETIMTEKLMKHRIRNFSLENSYVEHIGQNSVLNQWRPTPVNNAVYGLNMPAAGWPTSIEKADTFGYYRYVKKSKSWGDQAKSDQNIDVFIPVIEKDIQTLPYVIQGLRKNLNQPIRQIAIIAPNSNRLIAFCRENQCDYINENEIAPINKEEIKYFYKGIDRSGWLYQQFIKLSLDRLSETPYFYVIDADTILTSPQILLYGNKMVFLHSDEHHPPYFSAFQRLFGYNPRSSLSFVSHQMVFSKPRLIEFKEEIEKKNNKKWVNAVLDIIDYNEPSGFSEFESYGQWMFIHYPKEMEREYWFNFHFSNLQEENITETIARSKNCRSISLHKYQLLES